MLVLAQPVPGILLRFRYHRLLKPILHQRMASLSHPGAIFMRTVDAKVERVVYNGNIMVQEKILLIERIGRIELTFASALERKDYDLEVVGSGRAAEEAATAGSYALIILNAASLGTTGLRICQRLRDQLPTMPVIHILPEDTRESDLKISAAHVSLRMPFTPRKLINRIIRFMPQPSDNAIKAGSITLYPDTRIVHGDSGEKRLTPRAARLLEVFLIHPGKVLDRSYLMREVWDTNYVGDTRTLDVHIRWIREAVEATPRKPRKLLTVRGVGYRFEPAGMPKATSESKANPGSKAKISKTSQT